MSTTSAPRSQAASATRYPILPLERLVTTRTGSIDSRVGPAVTTIRRPASLPPPRSTRAAWARIVSGSLMRPGRSRGPLGERADLRTDDGDASRPQPLQVGLGLGAGVHLVVHRRRDQHRCGAGEQQRGEDVVGQALRHAGDEMRGGRRHDDEMGVLRQADVRERPSRLPEGGQDRAPGQRLECGGADELGGAAGEDDVHPGSGLGQAAGEQAALIAGDPARHAENDVPAAPHLRPRSGGGGPACSSGLPRRATAAPWW